MALKLGKLFAGVCVCVYNYGESDLLITKLLDMHCFNAEATSGLRVTGDLSITGLMIIGSCIP